MNTTTPWWRWLLTLAAAVLLWQLASLLGNLVALAVAGDQIAVAGSFWPVIALSLVQTTAIVLGGRQVLRIANRDWAFIGFAGQNFKRDALYGAAAGLALALLQYFLILPLTGGLQRSDIIATAELMGPNPYGLVSLIIRGWLAGALAEEIFYRGLFIRSLHNLLGGKRWALAVSSIVSIALFAVGHSYQGWIGMVSTGFMAAIYTALYLWRGRLTAGIVAHGVYNTLAVLGIYFLLV